MNIDLKKLRKEYTLQSLSKADVLPNPIDQFEVWINEALNAQVSEPNAMTLATSTFQGKPSARIVLLKEVRKDGLVFFTNYESKKGMQILQNPFGALIFYWPELERQVRIEGKIIKTSDEESDKYFKTRPKGSKLGAWASPQSQELPNRRYLDSLKSDFREEFENRAIDRPDNWGGYILSPTLMEFWQGRKSRLHDRIEYYQENELWEIRRLAP